MKSSSLFLLVALFSVRVFSQTTFSPGYIVKNGDTLRGTLKVDRQKDLMLRVSFRKDGRTDPTEYTPSDISAFRYDDGALYQTISFVNTAEANRVTETFFGQTLVSGAYSLYRVDKKEATYYIVRKDTSTYFLYDDKISGSDVVNGNYRSLLLLFSSGCEGLDQSRASYTDKSLMGFM
ncbi:MAG TPA: hypothetical protein VGQ51_06870 [Puia sp.]|nr:hypothetical protein [Puia sp.]